MTTVAHASPAQSHSAFIRARIGSLLAVLPLSVWTVVHLWNNLAVFQGEAKWQSQVTDQSHPLAPVFTAVVVLLPLVLHAIWGIGRLLTSRPNNNRYGYFANFKYLIQRLSAIGVLLFLGAHIWLALLKPRFIDGHAERFADIAHEMRFHTPTLIVYLLGTLGVAYHVANGLQTFAMGWGLVRSKQALRRLDGAAIGLFVVLLAMSWGAIYGLFQAGQ